MLWPSTADGTMPQDVHNFASETSIPNHAGCAYSVRASLLSVAESTPMTDHPANFLIWASHSSSDARKTGKRLYKPRPMRSHCEPCPEKTNTTFLASCVARPRAIPGLVLPARYSSNCVHIAAVEDAVTASRSS